MRTLLICHEGDDLNRQGLARWLASFTTLVGVLVIREPNSRMRQRFKRELQRVGFWRFLDVLAFRVYYRLVLARKDDEWIGRRLRELSERYPPTGAPELITGSPNSHEAEDFIRQHQPEFVVARCKTLLAERVFTIPSIGTFVMHPGICPEYRNAHGCFWALAQRDLEHVGMTLLKIDQGVDTGPVLGYFPYLGDERLESHIVIQHRVVFDHLDEIRRTFERIERNEAEILEVGGRPSATWGQPWLTAWLHWKRSAASS